MTRKKNKRITFDENLEISSSDFFRESARADDIFKKFTARNEFKDNSDDFVRGSVLFDVIDFFVEFNEVQDMRMFEI